MTEDDVRRLLQKVITDAGSQKTWAEKMGISQVYVSDTLVGRRSPAGKILTALGLERVVTYRRKPQRKEN